MISLPHNFYMCLLLLCVKCRLSKPFYTGPKGYKMCLGVFPGGNGDGKGNSISVFIHMMKGECDSELKWPFRGSVVVELLNQMADHTHHR